jgi:hypothetical protein
MGRCTSVTDGPGIALRPPHGWARLLALVLLPALLASLAAAGFGYGALLLVPAVLLALPLLLGRYPGERTIARLQRPRQPRALTKIAVAAGILRPTRPRIRGGRLVACSLAGRGPPLLALR